MPGPSRSAFWAAAAELATPAGHHALETTMLEVRQPVFYRETTDSPSVVGAAVVTSLRAGRKDEPTIPFVGLAEAMVRRALALDETFGFGSLHDFLMALEGGRPPSAGGSVARARVHLARAIELSNGLRAAPYVSFAESVCVKAQDKKEFEELLGKALAVDVEKAPTQRLANVLAQKRARWLLTRLDDLFIE